VVIDLEKEKKAKAEDRTLALSWPDAAWLSLVNYSQWGEVGQECWGRTRCCDLTLGQSSITWSREGVAWPCDRMLATERNQTRRARVSSRLAYANTSAVCERLWGPNTGRIRSTMIGHVRSVKNGSGTSMYLTGRHVVVSSVISNCKSYRHLTARVLELDRWDHTIVVKSQGHVDGVHPVIPHLRV
jgi:hypothetical protein